MIYSVWLSCDYGKDCYSAIMEVWLDKQHAEECCNGLAFFKYDAGDKPLRVALLADIKKFFIDYEDDVPSRIYAIWLNTENGVTTDTRGEFLVGSREKPNWYGDYYEKPKDSVDIGEVST